jgi:hypothetical protein
MKRSFAFMDFYEIKDKEELLTKYAKDYYNLQELIMELNEDLIDYTPSLEDAWTIREHIAHLVDTEINTFIRYRKSIVDKGVKLNLGGGDIKTIKDVLCYKTQKIDDSIEMLILLRKIAFTHLSQLKKEDWNQFTIEHPDRGVINLNMILSIATQHYDKHIEYINRNVKMFEEK